MSCQIQPNPDVAGIGVRVSIYFQAFFTILSGTIRFFWFPEGSNIEEETNPNSPGGEAITTVFASSMVIILTGLAIVASGIIQAIVYDLSAYHALLLLNLSWIIIISTLAPFFIIRMVSAKLRISLNELFWIPRSLKRTGPVIERKLQYLGRLHTLHFTITACFGLWFFSRLHTFDASPDNCTSSTVASVVGYDRLVTAPSYRIFSLVLYSFTSIPVIGLALVTFVLLWVPFIPSLILIAIIDSFFPGLGKHGGAIAIMPCVLVVILLIVSTEKTIQANNVLPGEGDWTLGQTLACFAALISTLDFVQWLWEERRQFLGKHFGTEDVGADVDIPPATPQQLLKDEESSPGSDPVVPSELVSRHASVRSDAPSFRAR